MRELCEEAAKECGMKLEQLHNRKPGVWTAVFRGPNDEFTSLELEPEWLERGPVELSNHLIGLCLEQRVSLPGT